MGERTHGASARWLVAAALLVTVVLQVAYMALLGGPKPADPTAGLTNADVLRYFADHGTGVTLVWTTESVAFVAIMLGGVVALVREPSRGWLWACLAAAGLFNLVQIGFGLAMFQPAALAGGGENGLFFTFVSGAFFFYFLAKLLAGLGAMALGWELARNPQAARRIGGWLALVAGLVSAIANLLAMAQGNAMLMAAGASGTACALVLALALLTAGDRPGPAFR